jgi:5-methylcytosine-specific restriction endonuclease McrA
MATAAWTPDPDDEAEREFILTHSFAEVAARRREAFADPKWRKRWWAPKPGPPTKWNPPPSVRCAVAARYGCAPGSTLAVSCPRCGASGEIRWGSTVRFVGMHLDHIVPRARGGADTAENLQLLCPPCNWRKGARMVA